MLSNINSKRIGISCVLFSTFCYALMNCILKEVSHDLSALIMVFYRNLFLVIVLLPFLFGRLKDFRILTKGNNLILNIARGSLGFIGICCWVISMDKLPITICVAISFTTPLFITLMAILLLREKVSLSKWMCLLMGFFGALIVMSPDMSGFSYYSLLVLIAALFWAASAIVIKIFVVNHNPVLVILFTSFISLLLSSPSMMQKPILLTWEQCFFILSSSVLSALAQISMAFAYKKADITVVIPFDFMRLVFTAIIAYLLFDEILSLSTIIGSLIIILSAFLIAWMEIKAKKEQKGKIC